MLSCSSLYGTLTFSFVRSPSLSLCCSFVARSISLPLSLSLSHSLLFPLSFSLYLSCSFRLTNASPCHLPLSHSQCPFSLSLSLSLTPSRSCYNLRSCNANLIRPISLIVISLLMVLIDQLADNPHFLTHLAIEVDKIAVLVDNGDKDRAVATKCVILKVVGGVL